MRVYYLLILIPLFFACESEETSDDQINSMLTISSSKSYNETFDVNLMASDTLFVGYNKLYFEIKQSASNQPVSEANIKLMPMMHMVSMSHSAPVENPESFTNSMGYFEGAIVFLMPDNADEYWELKVAIDAEGDIDTVKFIIPYVKGLDEDRKINVMSDIDDRVYFISLVEPSEPEVGINDIEFTVHYRQNMMNFPAAEDVTISFEPEMPSMAHGSPNNIQPIHIGNGHFTGKINFTMTGWWRINIALNSGDHIISDDDSFDVTL